MQPLDLQTPRQRPLDSGTAAAANLFTPDSPLTRQAVKMEAKNLKPEYPSPPENLGPRASLFRPWDTPESLSPTSSDNVSPTASNKNSSPPSVAAAVSGGEDSLSPLQLTSSPTASRIMFQVASSDVAGEGFPGFTVRVDSSSLEDSQVFSLHGHSSSLAEVPSTPVLQSTSSPAFHYPPSSFLTTAKKVTPTTGNSELVSLSRPINFSTSPTTEDETTPPSSRIHHNHITPSPLSAHSFVSPPSLSFISPSPLSNYISPPGLLPASRGVKRMRQEDIGASPSFNKKIKTEPGAVVATPLKGRASAAGGSAASLPACGVCEDTATGQHYGAPVCEGCKVKWVSYVFTQRSCSDFEKNILIYSYIFLYLLFLTFMYTMRVCI